MGWQVGLLNYFFAPQNKPGRGVYAAVGGEQPESGGIPGLRGGGHKGLPEAPPATVTSPFPSSPPRAGTPQPPLPPRHIELIKSSNQHILLFFTKSIIKEQQVRQKIFFPTFAQISELAPCKKHLQESSSLKSGLQTNCPSASLPIYKLTQNCSTCNMLLRMKCFNSMYFPDKVSPIKQ